MGFDSVYSRRSRLRLGLPLGSHASISRAPPFFSNELSAYRDATALRWKTYRYAFSICTAVCTCFCVPSFGSCSVYGFFPGLKLPSKKKVRSLQSGWNLTPIYFRRPERPLSVAVSNCDLTSRLLLSARLYDAAPLRTGSTMARPRKRGRRRKRCSIVAAEERRSQSMAAPTVLGSQTQLQIFRGSRETATDRGRARRLAEAG